MNNIEILKNNKIDERIVCKGDIFLVNKIPYIYSSVAYDTEEDKSIYKLISLIDGNRLFDESFELLKVIDSIKLIKQKSSVFLDVEYIGKAKLTIERYEV